MLSGSPSVKFRQSLHLLLWGQPRTSTNLIVRAPLRTFNRARPGLAGASMGSSRTCSVFLLVLRGAFPRELVLITEAMLSYLPHFLFLEPALLLRLVWCGWVLLGWISALG